MDIVVDDRVRLLAVEGIYPDRDEQDSNYGFQSRSVEADHIKWLLVNCCRHVT